MGQYREMVAQAQTDQSAHAEHLQMDAAMTDAANTNDGVSKRELMTFFTGMQQSNSAATATLHQGLQEIIAASHRATEIHATALEQEMAMQSRKQDQRDAVVVLAQVDERRQVSDPAPGWVQCAITYSLRRALPCPIKEGKEALQTLDDYKSSAFHRQAVTDKRL